MAAFVPAAKASFPAITRLTSKFIPFTWGEQEEAEFLSIKEKLYNVVPLSPVDTEKPLILHTDASRTGVGWVLTQCDDLMNLLTVSIPAKALWIWGQPL